MRIKAPDAVGPLVGEDGAGFGGVGGGGKRVCCWSGGGGGGEWERVGVWRCAL